MLAHFGNDIVKIRVSDWRWHNFLINLEAVLKIGPRQVAQFGDNIISAIVRVLQRLVIWLPNVVLFVCPDNIIVVYMP